MITAINVANSILVKSFSENIDITPMKLQKIIYFVYRDYMKETNGQELFEERFETWKYGPVLPSVYREFRKYSSNAIRRYATEFDGKTVMTVNEDSSPIFRKILNQVWEQCKKFDGIYLSSITHREGSAWRKAADRNDCYLSAQDIMQEEIAIA